MTKKTESDGTKSVVVATMNCEKALYIVAKDAMLFDELEICFTEKYAPTVEYILRMLRKAFGWMETDRGTKEVVNTRCRFNVNGFCACDQNLKERGQQRNTLKCTEAVRINCSHYQQKYKDGIQVNFVTIEKAGGIRNM